MTFAKYASGSRRVARQGDARSLEGLSAPDPTDTLHQWAQGGAELMPRSKPAAPARLRDLAGGAVLREFVEGLDVGSQPVHLLLRHRHGGKALSRAAEPVKFLARVFSVSEIFRTDVGSRVLNAGLRPAEGRPKAGRRAARGVYLRRYRSSRYGGMTEEL